MSSSFSFKTSSFSSLIICISLNITCERDDFMYRISNPQLLHYNGSKYLGIGIFIDNCFTYNLLCPISISDEQTDNTSLSLNFIELHIEQLPPMPKHPENIHKQRYTTGKIQDRVCNVGFLQKTIQLHETMWKSLLFTLSFFRLQSNFQTYRLAISPTGMPNYTPIPMDSENIG